MSTFVHHDTNKNVEPPESIGLYPTISMTADTTTKKPKKKQVANRARHRLLSINRDATTIQSTLNFLVNFVTPDAASWPIIRNERCGTWYFLNSNSCYFKSTDGHRDTWNYSFKRLNLHLLDFDGGCILLDSSVRKIVPDSFSRTIPIWACVLNRIVLKYRNDLDIAPIENWDTSLYTPDDVVSPEERSQISALLDEHVETLYHSKAIVNPHHLTKRMTKPIRPIWITNGGSQILDPSASNMDDYFWIVCVNPSTYNIKNGKNHVTWVPVVDEEGFYYVPGAADDQESWSRQLTPELFWQNQAELTNPYLSEDEVDEKIDAIVSHATALGGLYVVKDNLDQIGHLSLWIASRRAGRPPHCWDKFDAILNVTDQEYETITETRGGVYYLQLPVAEGKRDRTELERWMPVGLLFLVLHLQQKRRVLIHCNQGKDRSVAVALAFVALACPMTFPLDFVSDFGSWKVNDVVPDSEIDQKTLYQSSGLVQGVVEALLQEDGKEIFLHWIHSQKQVPPSIPLADKHRLRIALHLIKQDRSEADPTRSTLQKVNRFFMSSPMYRK